MEKLNLIHDNTISWYSCGPTVYDHSHLGHARNYVCLDIILRILEDHFKYNIIHVLGMTDVDDKIIIRANELGVSPRELAMKFENDFFNDMRSLHIRRPTVCSRVTEHISNIIPYIEKIIENGYAYKTLSGSVYFDTEKLGKEYGKFISIDKIEEGEDGKNPEKKNFKDFVLWKSTTHGSQTVSSKELSWKTPWSDEGRPGWHIECSAMSSRYLGGKFDVHWGGIDLKFPHHNNEIAQAEGYHKYHLDSDKTNWVNYWLHSGHLHIQGHKMSKSLKNFITIKSFLEDYGTADEFRMFCANVGYGSDVDFHSDRVKDSRNQIKRFNEFFYKVEMISKEKYYKPKYWTDTENKLFYLFQTVKDEVNYHLSNNFDTGKAIKSLQDLIRYTNTYMVESEVCTFLIENISEYIRTVLSNLGFEFAKQREKEKEMISSQEDQQELLRILLEFRSKVRKELLSNEEGFKNRILKEADIIRDIALPNLGIIVKDLPDRSYQVRHLSEFELKDLENKTEKKI